MKSARKRKKKKKKKAVEAVCESAFTFLVSWTRGAKEREKK